MAAKIASGSPDATEFFSLANLERQAMFLLIRACAAENAYNTNNPNAVSNKATIAVNYDNRTCTGQLTCALSDNAVQGSLVDGVQPFLP